MTKKYQKLSAKLIKSYMLPEENLAEKNVTKLFDNEQSLHRQKIRRQIFKVLQA